MAKQVIGIGTTANDKTGDKLRVAFDKINDNFAELYDGAGEATPTSITDSNWSLEVDDQEEGWYRLKYQDTTKAVFIVRGNGDLFIGSENGAIKLCSNDGPVWELKGDGTTVIPEGARIVCRQLEGNSTGDSYIEAGMGFRMHSGEGVVLEAANVETEQTHYWYFNLDGSINFPPLPGPVSSIGGSNNNTLQFGYAEQTAVISTKSGIESYNTPDDLAIASGDGWGYGGGSDISILGGAGGKRSESFGETFTLDCTVLGDPNNQISISIVDYNLHSGVLGNATQVSFAGHVFRITALDYADPVVITLDDTVGSFFEGVCSGVFSDAFPDAYAGNGANVVLVGGRGISGGGAVLQGGDAIHSDEIPWCGGLAQVIGGNSSYGTGGHVVLQAGQNLQGTFGRQGNIKMTTSRGTVTFGGEPEEGPTAPSHWHIVPSGGIDLFFGDDSNHFKLPAAGAAQIKTTDSGTQEEFVWGFEANGTSILPGATVHPTAAPTAGPYPQHGPALTITVSNSPNLNWITGTGIGLGDITATVEVDGAGNATVTVNDGGFDHYPGETLGSINGASFGGTTPADDMTFEVASISDGSSPISLTKTVQALDEGYYTLADGAEGQVMYFTMAGNSFNPGNVWIVVTNLRMSSSNYTDIWWNPFFGGYDVSTAIFVGGCWQFSSGTQD